MVFSDPSLSLASSFIQIVFDVSYCEHHLVVFLQDWFGFGNLLGDSNGVLAYRHWILMQSDFWGILLVFFGVENVIEILEIGYSVLLKSVWVAFLISGMVLESLLGEDVVVTHWLSNHCWVEVGPRSCWDGHALLFNDRRLFLGSLSLQTLSHFDWLVIVIIELLFKVFMGRLVIQIVLVCQEFVRNLRHVHHVLHHQTVILKHALHERRVDILLLLLVLNLLLFPYWVFHLLRLWVN